MFHFVRMWPASQWWASILFLHPTPSPRTHGQNGQQRLSSYSLQLKKNITVQIDHMFLSVCLSSLGIYRQHAGASNESTLSLFFRSLLPNFNLQVSFLDQHVGDQRDLKCECLSEATSSFTCNQDILPSLCHFFQWTFHFYWPQRRFGHGGIHRVCSFTAASLSLLLKKSLSRDLWNLLTRCFKSSIIALFLLLWDQWGQPWTIQLETTENHHLNPINCLLSSSTILQNILQWTDQVKNFWFNLFTLLK